MRQEKCLMNIWITPMVPRNTCTSEKSVQRPPIVDLVDLSGIRDVAFRGANLTTVIL